MKIRAIRAGSNAYFIDVWHNGQWHMWNEYMTMTKRQVRQFKSLDK